MPGLAEPDKALPPVRLSRGEEYLRRPSSASGSRTALTERSGAKIQLTRVTGAALTILMVRAAPGLFGNLRQFALAAMALPHNCP